MNNLRFATAIHILTLLHQYPDHLLSSDYVAGSININPSVVRKEISNLRMHGLVAAKEGKGGGIWLGKPAKKIKLSDVYKAIQHAPVLGKTNAPNPECQVGKQINAHIGALYNDAENALLKTLSKTSLEDFGKLFQ